MIYKKHILFYIFIFSSLLNFSQDVEFDSQDTIGFKNFNNIVKSKYIDSKIYNKIIYYSNKNLLDSQLVFSLIHAESNFNVFAVSKKNAKGLMQLLNSTYKIYCSSNNIYSIDNNLFSGTRHLKYLLNNFNDPVLSIAAYNAGENNIKKHKGIPPFKETIKYVKKIKYFYKNYKYIKKEI